MAGQHQKSIQDVWRSMARTARASLGVMLVAIVALALPSQTGDMVAGADWHTAIAFQVTLILLALSVWHWSRAVLSARFHMHDTEHDRKRVVTQLAPVNADIARATADALAHIPHIAFLGAATGGAVMAARSGAWIHFAGIVVWAVVGLALLRNRLELQCLVRGPNHTDMTLAGRRDLSGDQVEGHLPPPWARWRPLGPVWVTVYRLALYAPMGATVALALLGIGFALFVFGGIEHVLPLGSDWQGLAQYWGEWLPGPSGALLFLALAIFWRWRSGR